MPARWPAPAGAWLRPLAGHVGEALGARACEGVAAPAALSPDLAAQLNEARVQPLDAEERADPLEQRLLDGLSASES